MVIRGNDVHVNITGDADGVTRAVSQLVQELRQLSQTEGDAARGGQTMELSLSRVARQAAALFAVVQVFDAIRDGFIGVVRTGIEFNQQMESSALGIATLITAQSELADVNGRVLRGQEALTAAQGLAEDQLVKLRIAGIQTAATTEDLVVAFQEAVGAGQAAGLNLDQIRTFTVRMAQAGQALNLPFRQLNQEVRSILEGSIDVNSRIAKALGITNEQVRLAREQNRLAEFLEERLAAFAVAGERTAQTFAAMRSNLSEALSVFSGAATEPLFDQLSEAGQEALGRIFNLETAEISDSFQGLLDTAESLFGRMGALLASAIEAGVDRAEALSEWLEQNREEVEAIADQFGNVVDAIAEISGDVAAVVGDVIRWGVESGAIAETFETIADIIRFIRDNPIIPTALLGAGAVALAIASPAAAAAAAVTALVVGIHGAATAEEELAAQTRAASVEQAKQTTQSARLVSEFRDLSDRLRDQGTSAGEAERAQGRLKEITDELIRLNPEYKAAIDEATQSNLDLADALEQVARAEALKLQADIGNARIRQQEAQRRLDQFNFENAALLEAPSGRFDPSGFNDIIDQQVFANARREQRELQGEVDATTATLQELDQAFRALADPVSLETQITVNTGTDGESPEDRAKEALDAVARRSVELLATTKAALERAERDLALHLANNTISYEDYYAELTRLQLEAIDTEIALRRESLALTIDPDARAKINAELIQLEADRERIEAENQAKRLKAEEDLAKKIQDVQVRTLEAEGRTAEARRIQLEAEFGELIDRLTAEGDQAGVQIVRRLLNVEVARAQMRQLEDVVKEAQARLALRLEEIETRQEAGILSDSKARESIAAAYREISASIEQVLPRMEALAATSGDPKMAAGVAQLRAELDQLQLKIVEAEDVFREFRQRAVDDATQALTEFFDTGISEAEDLGDAFRALAASVVASLRRMAAEMLATLIVQNLLNAAIGATTGAAGGGGEAAGAVNPSGVFAASGGLIRGPGTGTSDSIPAWLSSGEYVLSAAAVRRLGTELLDELNFGASRPRIRPLRRTRNYAEGGLVDSAGSGGGVGHLEATLGLEDGLVLRELSSTEGVRAVMKALSQNRRAARSALGI